VSNSQHLQMKQFWKNNGSGSSRTYWLLLKSDDWELQATVATSASRFSTSEVCLSIVVLGL
jgi:hypothetical protein